MAKHKLHFLAPVALLASSLAPSLASAQTENQAAAEVLFDEARRLAKAGDHAAACPKFAESQRLDAGIGTLLHLADCYEKIGKTASAWAAFREAYGQAKQANQPERARLAEEHASKLEARLSRLVIRFPAGVIVKRGGVTIAAAASGVAFPVDPGLHEISAEAQGKKRWSTSLEIKGPGETLLRVPELEPEAAPAAAPVAPAAPAVLAPVVAAPATAAVPAAPVAPREQGMTPLRVAGFAGLGLGAVSLGVGAFFGSKAWSNYADRRDHCSGNVCDQKGVDLTKEARSQANLSTILVGTGVLLGGAGAALLIRGRQGQETAIAPVVGPAVAGFAVRGSL